MCAHPAAQLSRHHCSRSAAPDAAYTASSMVTIAANRRAQAADSTRDHASTAAAPQLPAVSATNSSNMHSNLTEDSDPPPPPKPHAVDETATLDEPTLKHRKPRNR